MNEHLYDYRGSVFRSILTWIAYPIGVILPVALIVAYTPEEGIPLPFLGFALLGLVTCWFFEKIHPHAKPWKQQRNNDLWTDIAHNTLSVGLAQVIRPIMVVGLFSLINMDPNRSFAIMEWPSELPLAVQVILALIIAEFGGYWIHRMFHENLFMWRFHAVHHSARRMYFLNAPRFHVVNLLVTGLLVTIPLNLAGAPTDIVILMGIFMGIHGNWQHGNVRQKLGWFNWVISSAELHRWHHSTDWLKSNSNYGTNLIIWDVVFGTRYLPKFEQDVKDGIGLGKHDSVFPTTWLGHQLIPFQWVKKFGVQRKPGNPPKRTELTSDFKVQQI